VAKWRYIRFFIVDSAVCVCCFEISVRLVSIMPRSRSFAFVY